MAEKKNNNYIVTIVLLLIGYYIIKRFLDTSSKQPPTNISTGGGNNGVPVGNGIISIDNPTNPYTEELTGVTTNPVEVTDITGDQTTGIATQCYTGCPNPSSTIVNTTSGDCSEVGLYQYPLPCANPNNNIDNQFIEYTENSGTGGLGNSASGMGSTISVGCGVTGLTASQVFANNVTPESPTRDIADTNVVSSTGLNNNVSLGSGSQVEVNQGGLGVYDFNSGFSNAYNEPTTTAVATPPTQTNNGLPTRNTNR